MTAGLPKELSFICLRRYNLLQFFYITGSQMKNGRAHIKKLSAMTGRYDLNTRNHQERIDAFYLGGVGS
jgi:hypothetical protein